MGARERVMQAGCGDVVARPLEVRAFLDRVRVWTHQA